MRSRKYRRPRKSILRHRKPRRLIGDEDEDIMVIAVGSLDKDK